MNTLTLLSTLRHLGVTVAANGDRLHIEAPKGAVSAELRTSIRNHKPELLQLLRNSKEPTSGNISGIESPRHDGKPLRFAMIDGQQLADEFGELLDSAHSGMLPDGHIPGVIKGNVNTAVVQLFNALANAAQGIAENGPRAPRWRKDFDHYRRCLTRIDKWWRNQQLLEGIAQECNVSSVKEAA